jgi:hypothetical protein
LIASPFLTRLYRRRVVRYFDEDQKKHGHA